MKQNQQPKILLTSNIPGYSLEEIFTFASKSGFDGIEYVLSIQDLFLKPKRALNLSKKYNIPILSLHQPILSIIYLPSFLFKNLINNLKYFEQVSVIVIHLSSVVNFFGQRATLLKKLQLNKKVQLCFESNNASAVAKIFPRATYDPLTFSQFIKMHHLLMTFDASHIGSFEKDLVGFLDGSRKYVGHVHLSDKSKYTEHLLLGDGYLPIKNFLLEIRKKYYGNFITFEIRGSRKSKQKNSFLKHISKNLEYVRNISHE